MHEAELHRPKKAYEWKVQALTRSGTSNGSDILTSRNVRTKRDSWQKTTLQLHVLAEIKR
jgi:hypothetical protein